MTTFARITAIVLIAIGIFIMLSGLALAVTGTIRSVMSLATAAHPARAGGLTGLFLIALLFAHGLLVTGAGEGLYLLAGISHK